MSGVNGLWATSSTRPTTFTVMTHLVDENLKCSPARELSELVCGGRSISLDLPQGFGWVLADRAGMPHACAIGGSAAACAYHSGDAASRAVPMAAQPWISQKEGGVNRLSESRKFHTIPQIFAYSA